MIRVSFGAQGHAQQHAFANYSSRVIEDQTTVNHPPPNLSLDRVIDDFLTDFELPVG